MECHLKCNSNNSFSSIIFPNRKIHLYLVFLLDKVLLELHSKETAVFSETKTSNQAPSCLSYSGECCSFTVNLQTHKHPVKAISVGGVIVC